MAEERRRRLGVIGHPVAHSLSPVMHKAALAKLGLSYSYDAFDVTPEALGAFIEYADENKFLGLNVTVPHKTAVMEHLDELSSEAEMIGAVNTIKFSQGKKLGHNTDGTGFARSLEAEGIGLKGKSTIILGAGGAARAIAFQCVLEGAEIAIANRHRDKAEGLAKDIKSKLKKTATVVDMEGDGLRRGLASSDVIVNATSVGMPPNTEESILPKDSIPEGKTVMDIVYTPIETRLLRDAKSRGCKTINGAGMLVHQGAESIRLWVGIEAPIKEMREAVLSELKKR